MNVLDLEVYENYFLAMFKNRDSGVVRSFEMYDGHPFDRKEAMRILKSETVVTFNGNSFDLPLFGQACSGKSCSELKAICDDIIVNEKKPWEMGIESPRCDHIDIIEVAPGQASLKIYGGRMHTLKMQDLPITPSASISKGERALLRKYCENDLDNTIALYRKLEKQIALRSSMSAEYGIDLRSKSDAQIAEAVIKAEVSKLKGETVGRPRVSPSSKFKYVAPEFIQFQTPELQALLTFITNVEFELDAGGSPKCKALESQKVVICGKRYSMGIGGLHSNEKSVYHVADEDNTLADVDATSFYPSIILNCELYPEHLGREFLEVYRGIVERRIDAKKNASAIKKRIAELKAMLKGA